MGRIEVVVAFLTPIFLAGINGAVLYYVWHIVIPCYHQGFKQFISFDTL